MPHLHPLPLIDAQTRLAGRPALVTEATPRGLPTRPSSRPEQGAAADPVSQNCNGRAAPPCKFATLPGALHTTFALMISAATRALGALPAFGLAVLPALTGLRLARRMRTAALIAVPLGMGCAALGYYLSFVGELPTGACMVGLAGLAYLLSLAVPRRS